MQLLHENIAMRQQNLRFNNCRVAFFIDKKSFDKIHLLNIRSLVTKSNFLKKLLERSLLKNKKTFIQFNIKCFMMK